MTQPPTRPDRQPLQRIPSPELLVLWMLTGLGLFGVLLAAAHDAHGSLLLTGVIWASGAFTGLAFGLFGASFVHRYYTAPHPSTPQPEREGGGE